MNKRTVMIWTLVGCFVMGMLAGIGVMTIGSADAGDTDQVGKAYINVCNQNGVYVTVEFNEPITCIDLTYLKWSKAGGNKNHLAFWGRVH